ncbi:MAG: peptidoglycan DD-metalloendopeptidase family protein [Lachnospiraceae bacterium]|nr:peptidoglycan DD-metalloendopeptidase family protein [Lachnospiraceae bacterium]
MKKHEITKRIIWIALLFFIIWFFYGIGSNVKVDADNLDPKSAYEKKLEDVRKQKEELEKKKKEQEALISEFTQEKESIGIYIRELDTKLNEINERINLLKEEIRKTEENLEIARDDLEKAKEKEEKQYTTMKKRIAYMYENGEASTIDILLNSADISDFLNQVEYAKSITDYDNNLLERYKDTKKEVEEKQNLLLAALNELNIMKETEETEQATVQELIEIKGEEIENLLDKLGIADEYLFQYIDEISNKEVEIVEIIKEEQKRVEEEERKRKEEEERRKREEAELQRVAEEARKNNPEYQDKPWLIYASKYDPDARNKVKLTDEKGLYNMIMPIPGDWRTFSRFGLRKAPTKGATTYHKGWDIGGELNDPIVAVLAGTVESVGYDNSGGNYVRIEHQPGFLTVYCHCNETLVKQGEYVKQGQQIAKVGSTGVSTGPHLHFGIKIDGQFTDPAPYIEHLYPPKGE